MSYKRLKTYALLLSVFTALAAQAQENACATGGNASGSNGSASYSVGQAFYATVAGASGSVAQGVQQPYEISVLSVNEQAKNLHISAYPNPTADYIFLSLDFNCSDGADLSYQLYDMVGRLVQSEKITGTQTGIAMSGLVPATYFVKVMEGKNELETFKIIKK